MNANRAVSWPFLRLYALAFLFFSANSILNVIVPLRSETIGASNSMIGLIMGTYMFTCMFFRPWAGYFVQKYGPIRVLRTVLIMNGIALILYTVTGLEGYFVSRFLQGVSTAVFSMALQIGIIDSLPEEERSQGVSLYSLFTYMPSIVGPLIAIGIWEWGGMNAFTLSMVAIAVVTGLFGFGTSTREMPERHEEGLSANGMRDTVRLLFHHPAMLLCSVLMFIASVVFGSVSVFIPLYSKQVELGNAGVYFMIQAGILVLSRFLLRKRIPSDGQWHARFILGILIVAAVAALLLSLSPTIGSLYFYLSAVMMGIAQALLYPALMTYLTFVLHPASRNILIGLFIAAADLGISLGGIAMGPIADTLSYSTMYAICSGLLVMSIGFAIGFGRFMKNQPEL